MVKVSPETRAYIEQWLDTQPLTVVTQKGYGANAFASGQPIESNPHPEGTSAHDDWREGWLTWQAGALKEE